MKNIFETHEQTKTTEQQESVSQKKKLTTKINLKYTKLFMTSDQS